MKRVQGRWSLATVPPWRRLMCNVEAWAGGAISGVPGKCCSTCSTVADTRRSSHLKCGRRLKNCCCSSGTRTLLKMPLEKIAYGDEDGGGGG